MLDMKATTEVQESLRKLLKQRDWLSLNLKQVQAEYGERWVVIADEGVVAHGSTAEEVREKVKGKYSERESLTIMVPKGEISTPMGRS
jgi:ABC-type phosphate/phosphonate transport system ATPase subunit